MNTKTRFKGTLLYALLGIIVTSAALLIAGQIIFSEGSTVTNKATFSSFSGGQLITTTVESYYPGLMSQMRFTHAILYSLMTGGIMGLIAGVLIGLLRKGSLSKKAGLCAVACGCLFEYHMECLLVLILNAHYSEQIAPFHSVRLPLLGFQIVSSLVAQLFLNIEIFLLVQMSKLFGIAGVYVLYLLPALAGLLAIIVTRKIVSQEGY